MDLPYIRYLIWTLAALFIVGIVAGAMVVRNMQPAHMRTVTSETNLAEAVDSPSSSAPADASETVNADPNRVIFKSPRDCYAALQEASRAGDEAARLKCYDAKERNRRVGWFAYYLDREIFYERESADAARQLLKQHAVEPGRVMHYVHGSSKLPVGETEKLVTIIGSKIPQQAEFVAAAARLVSLTIGGEPIKAHELELTEVDIRGQVAIANVKNEEQGFSSPLYFKKTDGSWLISANF